MAKIVDKGNETNFKENDDVNQQNEILRKNQPFIVSLLIVNIMCLIVGKYLLEL